MRLANFLLVGGISIMSGPALSATLTDDFDRSTTNMEALKEDVVAYFGKDAVKCVADTVNYIRRNFPDRGADATDPFYFSYPSNQDKNPRFEMGNSSGLFEAWCGKKAGGMQYENTGEKCVSKYATGKTCNIR